jgi:hypothetical protein
MASERQIAANQANARKSTGPKTRTGRQRARGNSFRHGLSAVFNREALAEIEELARQLARGSTDPIILQHARNAAHAEFILARIPLIRVAWIQRAYELGTVNHPPGSVERQKFLAWLHHKGRHCHSPSWSSRCRRPDQNVLQKPSAAPCQSLPSSTASKRDARPAVTEPSSQSQNLRL